MEFHLGDGLLKILAANILSGIAVWMIKRIPQKLDERLKGMDEKLENMNHKIDNIGRDHDKTKERVAVLEYAVKIFKHHSRKEKDE